MPDRVALVPTMMVMLVGGPWEKTIDTFLPILNLWLVIRYLEKPTMLRISIAGLIAGSSLMFKQDLGVGSIMSGLVVVFLFANNNRATLTSLPRFLNGFTRAILYSGLVLVGLAPFPIFYLSQNALRDLVLGMFSIVGPQLQIAKGFPSLLATLEFLAHPRGALEVFLLYASLFILLSFPLVLLLKLKRWSEISPTYLSLWMFAVIAYPQTWVYPSITRLAQTGALTYALGTLMALWLVRSIRQQLQGHWHGARMTVNLVVFGLLGLPLSYVFFGFTDNNMYIGSIAIRQGRDTLLSLDRAQVYESVVNVHAITEVANLIKQETSTDDTIFAGYEHMLYFLADRWNPTGVYFLSWYLNQNPELRAKFLSDLEKQKPRLIIRRVNEDDFPWWESYLHEHYLLKHQNARYSVYERAN
jgi:hypothetical protein